MGAAAVEPGSATFPLVPRGRLIGVSYGLMRSIRRGSGLDVAGSRPYRSGDDVDKIDWAASARLSSARGIDEFIVRELHAEEAPRVIVLADRRPSLALYPEPLPWLAKWRALEEATAVIARSAVAARGYPGYLDYADGEAYWHSPRSSRDLHRDDPPRGFGAPEDTLELGLGHLSQLRPLPPVGTFLFVVSDFLAPPPTWAWYDSIERGWDVVPVVVQDPVWERSFPDVGGVAVPLVDAAGGRPRLVRLTAREAAERRRANERRYEELLASFDSLGLEPIVLDDHAPAAVVSAFLDWSDGRVAERGRGW
jgi:uncharacterized protein (DUF58 family)